MKGTRGHLIYNTFSMGHFFNTISRRGRTCHDVRTCNHASHHYLCMLEQLQLIKHGTHTHLHTHHTQCAMSVSLVDIAFL